MKATRVLNLLRRAMQGCSKQAKARAYIALVRPHLETCSPVWTSYQKGAQDDLEKVQKCAARWICAKWDKANYCWTIINNLDCLRFDDYFCFNQSSTRSHRLTLCCASSRINAYRYSFFYKSSLFMEY